MQENKAHQRLSKILSTISRCFTQLLHTSSTLKPILRTQLNHLLPIFYIKRIVNKKILITSVILLMRLSKSSLSIQQDFTWQVILPTFIILAQKLIYDQPLQNRRLFQCLEVSAMQVSKCELCVCCEGQFSKMVSKVQYEQFYTRVVQGKKHSIKGQIVD